MGACRTLRLSRATYRECLPYHGHLSSSMRIGSMEAERKILFVGMPVIERSLNPVTSIQINTTKNNMRSVNPWSRAG